MIKISTKLANYLCDENCLTNLVNTGFAKIFIFGAVQPSNPEQAHSGQLVTIFNDGAGVYIGSPTDGVCSVVTPCTGLGEAAGTAKSFRICLEENDDGVSADNGYMRIDGTIGLTGSGADATVDKVEIAVDQLVSVTSFTCGISRGW